MNFLILLTTLSTFQIFAQTSDIMMDSLQIEEEKQYYNRLLERAESDNVYAQKTLADYYQSPQSPNRSLESAAFWYTKAAENGSLDAALSLGQIYSSGILGDEEKCETALYWYEIAATNGDPIAWTNIAWSLATCEDKKFRDGRRALEIMKLYGDKTGNVAGTIDTLAAIYAELGNFKEAITLQKTALLLINKNGNKERIKSQKLRLTLYKQNKSFSGFAHENPENFIE